MAFALTLFVEAANKRIPTAAMADRSLLHRGNEICPHLYLALCSEVDEQPAAGAVQPAPQTSLYSAFAALCEHYEGDPLQAAVCARVLAFHFLMERSAGAALADWVRPDPETPEFVSLAPAVVEAIATVRLHGSVLLSEGRFRELVAERAAVMKNKQVH